MCMWHREEMDNTECDVCIIKCFPYSHKICIHILSLSRSPQFGDSDAITEAHGLVGDLLISKESLPDSTHQKLKRVRELLAPRLDKLASPRVHVGGLISLSLSLFLSLSLSLPLPLPSFFFSHSHSSFTLLFNLSFIQEVR